MRNIAHRNVAHDLPTVDGGAAISQVPSLRSTADDVAASIRQIGRLGDIPVVTGVVKERRIIEDTNDDRDDNYAYDCWA